MTAAAAQTDEKTLGPGQGTAQIHPAALVWIDESSAVVAACTAAELQASHWKQWPETVR
jgi:hypothetical protein